MAKSKQQFESPVERTNRSRFKTSVILLVLLASIFSSYPTYAEDDETGNGDGGNSQTSPSSITLILSSTFRCLERKGLIKNEGAGRVDLAARAWGRAYELAIAHAKDTKTTPPTKNELHHLLAQIMWETGYLTFMTKEHKKKEKVSQYADRGFLQVTGRSNYKMCSQFAMKSGEDPRNLAWGGEAAENLMGDKATDLTLAALCSLGWWQNMKKVGSFAHAVEGGANTLDTVSSKVRLGPAGKLDKNKGSLEGRRKAYKDVGLCMK